jgi:hypothetical protein
MIAAEIIADRPPQDGREWDCQCARCGSSTAWEDCANCEDGYSHHDCGEDCCCCASPWPNVVCDWCSGRGGWEHCISDSNWCQANPMPGREDVPRGKLEWFTFERTK